MATQEPYEGGIGGKFRRRPFRRTTAATPYDRPPTAARAIHNQVGERNGWLSKLVDPASRVITSSASKLFSSVFRKRLGAPPPLAEQPLLPGPVLDMESSEQAPEAVSVNPSSDVRSQDARDTLKDKTGGDSISEVEQLLKQKTFTRAELDHLTVLLRSRIVDLPKDESNRIEPIFSAPAVRLDKPERSVLVQENGIGSSKLSGGIKKSVDILNARMVHEEEIASPTELAKAYMGSRPLKTSSPSLSLRSPATREALALPNTEEYVTKRPDVSIAPRSTVRSYGLSENGYRTSRPQGRSAIYKMSRSPYFKAQPMVPDKDIESSGGGYTGPSTSQWTPSNASLSGGRQVLKRRSSVLDNDIGSFGPIRRIRQKSNLVSPSKENCSSSGRYLSTPSVANGLQGFTLSKQKSHLLDGPDAAPEDAKDGENKQSCAGFTSVPLQSSQMARKILQQLDHLVPSPKEKLTELKAITRGESPSKLTLNMLHGQALKSVKEIDSSKIYNAEGSTKCSGSPQTVTGISTSQAEDKVGHSSPSKPVSSVAKVSSQNDAVGGLVVSMSDTKPGNTDASLVFSGSAATLPQKKPSFQMQAPESSWDLDVDHYGRDASDVSITEKEKPKSSIVEAKTVISETVSQKKVLVSSAENRLDSSSTPNRGVENKALDGPIVSGKDNGFTFPVASSHTDLFQVPLMPNLPTSLASHSAPPKDQAFAFSALPKEQTIAQSIPVKEQSFTPVFGFGSENAPTLTFSSTSPTSSASAGLKSGTRSEPKLEVLGSTAPTMITEQIGTPNSDKGKETETIGDSLKPLGSSISSGPSISTTPGAFAFGAPTTSSLNNGPLKSISSTLSVSAAPAAQLSDSSAGPTISGFSSPSISESAKMPAFPTGLLFQNGLSTTSISADSVASHANKCDSKEMEPKPFKGPSFGLTSFSAPATSSSFSSSSSGIFGGSVSAPSSAKFGSTSGQLPSTQTSHSGTGASIFTQSSTSQFGSSASSPSLGLGSSPTFGFSSSAFGTSSGGAKPFSFGSNTGSGQSSLSFAAGASTSSSSSTSSFGTPATASSLFSSTSQPATPSIFGSGFGSSASSAGLSFGLSPSASGSATLSFGSSSVSAFSFTSATATTTSTPASPPAAAFRMTTPVTFGSSVSGSDQMNVEDSMTDDTVQTAMPIAPAFGQAAVPPPMASNLSFGSPTVPAVGAVAFQFGSQPGSAFPPSQSPFQASGNLEFTPGGSFSLGSGAGDKANRRFVKIKRDNKHRKK